ncbi:MAG TPA: rhodanese-like domain-containing protein [Anaeromyxobacteraceae bacterium]|nr:rhodanese-like domain-containing protein [Anaeromyxobacteraceae bacterium]
MSVDPWVAIAIAVAAALFLLPRLIGARRVSSDVVKQKLSAGATVVDVRSPAEFQAGAYPGAVNIPIRELPARMAEISKAKPVVLYCESGVRSGSAAALLAKAGYTDVVNAGGLRHMPA